MDECLAAAGTAVDPVRVGVAAEKRHLEKEHTGGPDGGRPAEPWQDQLGDQGLHLEEKERAQQNGEREKRGRDLRIRYLSAHNGLAACVLIICKLQCLLPVPQSPARGCDLSLHTS